MCRFSLEVFCLPLDICECREGMEIFLLSPNAGAWESGNSCRLLKVQDEKVDTEGDSASSRSLNESLETMLSNMS